MLKHLLIALFAILAITVISLGTNVTSIYAVQCTVGNVTLDCADTSGCTYSNSLGYYCKGGAGGGSSIPEETSSTCAISSPSTCNATPGCFYYAELEGPPGRCISGTRGIVCGPHIPAYCKLDQNCKVKSTSYYCEDVTPPTPTLTPTPTADPAPVVNDHNLKCDFDKNGKIDIFDFNLWKEAFTKVSDKLADCDGDGKTTIFDFNLWKEAFIKTQPI